MGKKIDKEFIGFCTDCGKKCDLIDFTNRLCIKCWLKKNDDRV